MAKITIIFDDKKAEEYEITQEVALAVDKSIVDMIQNESEFESAEEFFIDYDMTNVKSSVHEIGDLEIAIDEANSSGYNNPVNIAEVNELKKKGKKDGNRKRNNKSSNK